MPHLDEALVTKWTKRALELAVSFWPSIGPADGTAINSTWRELCKDAGGDTPDVYEASSRADKIIAEARATEDWKAAVLEAIQELP